MMIKLKCCNEKCNFIYSVSENEFREYGEVYHKFCMICGSKLEVGNLEEIVTKDLYERAEEYLNEWIRTMGLEGALELCEKHKDEATGRIYMELLKKRGIIR